MSVDIRPDSVTPDIPVVFPENDHGTLTLPQRRCLAKLMRVDYLWAQDPNHAFEWATLMADTNVIRGRLNDMFLDLELDLDRGIAYKFQLRGGDHPILLKDTSYTREATILLVFLRQRYDSERRTGVDQVFVDRDECRDQVASLRPADANDEVGDRSKVDTAIKTLADGNILRKVGSDADRFLISPIIESILPVAKLHQLMAWLIEENSPGMPAGEQGSDDDSEGEL